MNVWVKAICWDCLARVSRAAAAGLLMGLLKEETGAPFPADTAGGKGVLITSWPGDMGTNEEFVPSGLLNTF